PLLGIALFIWRSPYAEMRFVYPSLLLIFISPALIAARWPRCGVALIVLVALVSALTSFSTDRILDVLVPAAIFGAAAVVTIYATTSDKRFLRQAALVGVVVAPVALGFVYWHAYVGQCREMNQSSDEQLFRWRQQYGPIADAWRTLRTQAGPGDVIAYAHTHLVYPLLGFDLDQRATYAPTSPQLADFTRLPAISDPVSGDQIVARMGEVMSRDPDRTFWLENLRNTGARYLVIGLDRLDSRYAESEPPELHMALGDPKRFAPVMSNGSVQVFEIRWE
ncbi:MAG: hypothetical protein ACREJC_15635, partial [Tepidisphaeraceae bacterium]